MKKLIGTIAAVTILATAASAQISLSGNSYTQDFNDIANGLPAGWSVKTSASSTSLGSDSTFITNATAWSSTSGGFFNVASVTNNSGVLASESTSSTDQAAFTNRQVGIKQTGSGGRDPGAALVFQALDTAGYSNLQFSVDLTMLYDGPRTTVWTIDYGLGASPATYTVLGTYTNTGSFGTTAHKTYSLGPEVNNQSDIVTIRIVALTGSTGSGSRDMFGVDNFSLTYDGSAIVLPPIITTQPASQVNLTNTTAFFRVEATGPGTLSYQWLKDGSPLSDGGQITGANSDSLFISAVTEANEGSYELVITNLGGAVTSSPPATLTLAGSGTLVRWKFNGNFDTSAPFPSEGDGAATASLAGGVSGFVQPNGSGFDFDVPNTAWGSSSYPAVDQANKTAGVQFNVSTAGKKNVMVSFDVRSSSTASLYRRIQFTTNGTDFIDVPTSSQQTTANIYETQGYDFTGFPGVRDNPNFGIRVVSEFESTATYGVSANSNYVGVSSTYGTSGTLSYDLVRVAADVIADATAVPTISTPADFSIADTDSATNITVTISDADTAAGSLTVTAVSSNTAVLFDPVVTGSADTRTLSITPFAGFTGVAPIIVKVTDPEGNAAVTWFYVTVLPGNQPPTISGLISTNTLGNTTNTYACTVGDDSTPVGSLTVTAFSGNTTLVPNDSAHLYTSGSDSNRTVTVIPAADQYGVVPILVTVDDGAKTSTNSFYLMVRPNTATLLDEAFDYDAGGPIIDQSLGLWSTHSGTPGQMQVGSGVLTVTDNNGEDVNAPLTDFSVFNPSALYASFTLNFSALPTLANSYFAHFKNDSFSYYGRLYADTATATPGYYRLGIGNFSTSGSPGLSTQDLSPGTNYTVVLRLDLTTGQNTFWIDPTDESSTSTTDTSSTGSVNPTTYAFREASGEGTMTIDNLKVGINFLTVVSNIVDIPPQANPDGYSIVGDTVDNVLSPLTNDVLNVPEGTLSIVSVSPTNGTATISGTNVLFTPTVGFSGTTTIGYTITDGFGGLSSSLMSVDVSSVAPTPEPIMVQTGTGQLIMSWDQANFSLASSTNVVGPYVKISGATSPYTNSTTSGTMFFRLVYP